jgi:hypothetical protein
MAKARKPAILLWDAETAPVIGHVWGLWENNVSLNQIERDWSILSWAAKWYKEKEIFYQDLRGIKNVENDKSILQGIWDLLDEADIVVTHNGKKFDKRKVNARFILNGMSPPSSYREIDTLVIAKKHFAFTSNKLEYLTKKLCNIKKSDHRRFPGHVLWVECMKGNKKAWDEMRKYNVKDITSLEELFQKLLPWDNTVNFAAYSDDPKDYNRCNCGGKYVKNGKRTYMTDLSEFQRYRCISCNSERKGSENLITPAKRKELLRRTAR